LMPAGASGCAQTARSGKMHEKAFITSSQSGDILAARSYDPSFFAAVPAAENTKPDGTTVGYQQPFRRVFRSKFYLFGKNGGLIVPPFSKAAPCKAIQQASCGAAKSNAQQIHSFIIRFSGFFVNAISEKFAFFTTNR
ncbi:hypothetical protein, partial [Ruminococcus sp. CAG:330]|uniref:hypothetical protein n=1 Tax=Ruminococcus sp. CAG:330 TaxID=1262954 RepID=UPI00263F805B